MTYNEMVFGYMYKFNSNPVFKCVKAPNGKSCIETAKPEKAITVWHKGENAKTYPSTNQGQCLYEVALGDYICIGEYVLNTYWIRDYRIIKITHDKIITKPC